jgi:hypothetical protein
MMIVLGAVCLSGLVHSSRADEITVASAPVATPAATTQDEDKWTFNSPLYFWAAGLNGDLTLGGRSAHLDLSPTDVLNHLDVGFMAYLELAKPQYGFYAQPNYMKLSANGGSAGFKANDDVQLWIAEFGGFYRIWTSGSDRPASLYALAGGRYWNIHNKLTINPPIGPNENFAGTKWLMDPIVGLRFEEYFTKRLHARVQADVGGFGLSSDTSRFSWQVLPTVGYDFTMPVIKKPSTVFAGWRQINVQYVGKSGGNKRSADLTLEGVIIGVNVQLF